MLQRFPDGHGALSETFLSARGCYFYRPLPESIFGSHIAICRDIYVPVRRVKRWQTTSKHMKFQSFYNPAGFGSSGAPRRRLQQICPCALSVVGKSDTDQLISAGIQSAGTVFQENICCASGKMVKIVILDGMTAFDLTRLTKNRSAFTILILTTRTRLLIWGEKNGKQDSHR